MEALVAKPNMGATILIQQYKCLHILLLPYNFFLCSISLYRLVQSQKRLYSIRCSVTRSPTTLWDQFFQKEQKTKQAHWLMPQDG